MPCNHLAHLYTDSSSMCNSVADYAVNALERGEAVILIATPEHTTKLLAAFQSAGHDSTLLRATGQVVCLDAEKVLAAIMRDQAPDERVFRDILCELIEQTLQRFPNVLAFGELVNLLWAQNNRDAAHTLERWWNELIHHYGFTLVCGYRVNVFDEAAQAALPSLCGAHSHVTSCFDEDRLDTAVNEAMRTTFMDADVGALRKVLSERSPKHVQMSSAQAALMALHDILPSVAQDVRMRARDHYEGRVAAEHCRPAS